MCVGSSFGEFPLVAICNPWAGVASRTVAPVRNGKAWNKDICSRSTHEEGHWSKSFACNSHCCCARVLSWQLGEAKLAFSYPLIAHDAVEL